MITMRNLHTTCSFGAPQNAIWLIPKGNEYVEYVHFHYYNFEENPAFEFAILVHLLSSKLFTVYKDLLEL